MSPSPWLRAVCPLAGLLPLALAVACASVGTSTEEPARAAPQPAGPETFRAAPAAGQAEPLVAPALAPRGRVMGIDVSHYQPDVDWETVRSSVSFVFIKATDSLQGLDPRFASHWEGARKAGIPRGAYHFFHPKHAVDAQVANFTRHLKSDPGELPPVVDVEEFRDEYQSFSCEQLAEMLKRFSQGVEKELGRKPMIYTNSQTWKSSFCAQPYLVDHPLWLAEYRQQPSEPRLPEGWKRWDFWQYTEKGTVAGIPTPVDQSYFSGTEQELKALCRVK